MKQWNAVVLAGDRGPSDPVAKAATVKGKAFAVLNSQSLIERIVETLHESMSINTIYVVGPEKKYLKEYESVTSLFNHFNITHIEPAGGPCASALKAIKQHEFYPTLLVTCDLALLNAEIIDEYCKYVIDTKADFVATAIDYQRIHSIMPQLKKTQYRFDGKRVCFANVFSVLTPAGLKAIEYWQDIESSRKNPIQLIRKIDWLSIVNYKIGRLSLDQVAKKLTAKIGANLRMETMPMPELAIDVDSAHDYQVMKDYFEN